jgi:hypothetical protein
MSVYAAITGGMFAFMAYSSVSPDNAGDVQPWWPLYFLVMLTFVGFFLSMRWTYAFECHRIKVNELARILWAESSGKSMFDPTMNIPAMRILPESIRSNKVIQFLQINKITQSLNNILRTRYLFPFFYFFMLIGLVIASLNIPGFPLWGQVTSIIAAVVAAILFFSWHTSLGELGKTKKIVIEGCNGEWAQQRYIPSLIVEAAKRNAELWAFDLKPEIKLPTSSLLSQWNSFQDKGKFCYQNKANSSKQPDRPYQVDYVFVVTPDNSHTIVATSWIDRLAPKGKIFIEKPIDANLSRAEELRGIESVFSFDHYLARAYPFLTKINSPSSQKLIVILNKSARYRRLTFILLKLSMTLRNVQKHWITVPFSTLLVMPLL